TLKITKNTSGLQIAFKCRGNGSECFRKRGFDHRISQFWPPRIVIIVLQYLMYQKFGRLAFKIDCWDGQCHDQGQRFSPMQWLIPLNISFRPVKQGTLTPTSRGKTGCSDSHLPLRPVKRGALIPTSGENGVL